MRTLAITENITVDGSIEMLTDWFDPQRQGDTGKRAGGLDKSVLLVETDDMNDEIDAAYRAKYHRYAVSIIGSIISPEARTATLKLVPR
jgi:hypothetical protein